MALTPSQRLNLKKEISGRLSPEDYPLIDTTLKEFGLPTTYEWNGEKYDYLLHALQDAPDQILIDLGAHVGFIFETTYSSLVEPAFWQKGMLRVFLSHLATHKVSAAKLQEAFLEYGISCFVAHNDI